MTRLTPRPRRWSRHNVEMRLLHRWIVATLAALVPSLAAADGDVWATPPFTDPLRVGSLPLDAAAARELAGGEWSLVAGWSYFNTWSGSWHTGTIHHELGRDGQPLQEDELRLLESRHPGDEIYRFDLQGWRADLTGAVGLGRGLVATLQVPRYGVGTPHWDAVATDFHAAFNFSNSRREWFPRGQTVVYARGRGGTVEAWDELRTETWGDASLSLAGGGGHWLGASHRWVMALEAPLGDEGTIGGSGGWDSGLRWFATWGSGRRQLRAGAGYTWLDGGGSFLGARRSDTWHLEAAARVPLSAALDLRVSGRLDSSPLSALSNAAPGDPSFYLALGIRAPLGADSWIAFDVGDNYPISGVAPDFSFHLQLGAVVGQH